MSDINIPVEFKSDEKGYFDRQCPNEKCEYVFKIYMEDWKEKVSDDQVFCPMCGHTATSDKWYTFEQIKAAVRIPEHPDGYSGGIRALPRFWLN